MTIARTCSIFIALALLAGCIAAMPTAIRHPLPVDDPEIEVDVNDPAKAYGDSTLLADNHRPGRPRIIEVDMKGRVIWEYPIPSHLAAYNNPGLDVEALPNGNILITGTTRLLEYTPSGELVWRLKLKVTFTDRQQAPALGFYKAQRL